MVVYRTILTVCFALILSSCMDKPIFTGKSTDMSREIKQNAPVVNNVDISLDGRYVLSGSFDSFILWDILKKYLLSGMLRLPEDSRNLSFSGNILI